MVTSKEPTKPAAAKPEDADPPSKAAKEPATTKDEKDPNADAADADLTDEDKRLQDDLNLCVERLSESDTGLHMASLETMRSLIRASTTSMTSVPKPLKFMRPHYVRMKEIHEKMADGVAKKLCGDIISVLAMCSDERRDCIKYRLLGQHEPIGEWGHEYVRHLTMEMGVEWDSHPTDSIDDAVEQSRAELLVLVKQIIAHNFQHNAEVEACDLLVELGLLPLLPDYVTETDHQRVCLYLLSCAPLTPNPDNNRLIEQARDIYLKFGKRLEALRCAMMLNNIDGIREIVLGSASDPLMQKQMAILLGRHQIFLELEDEKLAELNSNVHQHQYFRSLARELDIMEPKTPEAIYKAHLEHSRPFTSQQPDGKRQDLAASFVNGFVNCGFGVDKMLGDSEGAAKWFTTKNKEYATMSAAASLGLIYRWDVDNGLTHTDPFLSSDDDFVRAGTLLAIGIISCGIQDPVDPACAILIDFMHSDKVPNRIGAILGLGLAYANSKRETVTRAEDGGVIFELRKVFTDQKASANTEVKGLAALSLGLILVGTGDHEVAGDLLTYLMDDDKSAQDLKDPNYRFVALGIGLIFLGTQDRSEVFLESVKALPEPFGSMTATLIDVCAYAGTGSVDKVQQMLHICSEHYEPVKEEAAADKPSAAGLKSKTSGGGLTLPVKSATPAAAGTSTTAGAAAEGSQQAKEKMDSSDPVKVDYSSMQSVAVLGIALVTMGEDIGSQMVLRTFGHLMRYGEPVIRRTVPLALGLLSVSNPQLTILETLSKYSHDSDSETAHNAIFAMGLVGAGTNNARLVAMLRQLASYHVKDPVSMMLIRIAQGLTHLGKGTMTLNPFHSDRQLMCPAAMAGLFATCFAFIDGDKTVLNPRQHYLLYSLVVAIQPRLLITLVEESEEEPGQLKQINVQVRVGQAVDVVAQAGKPKTITGFQTHSTPVLLAYGERAELATEEWLPLTPQLEGLVILRKNPEWEANKAKEASKAGKK